MAGHEEALAMSARIAGLVEPHYADLGLGKRCFPSFQPPGELSPEDYLRELCEQGLRERYADPIPQEAIDRLTLCPTCSGLGVVRNSRWGHWDCGSPDEPCPSCQPSPRTVWIEP